MKYVGINLTKGNLYDIRFQIKQTTLSERPDISFVKTGKFVKYFNLQLNINKPISDICNSETVLSGTDLHGEDCKL